MGDAGNDVQTERANAEGDRSRKKSTHSRARRREAGPHRQRMSNRLNLRLRDNRTGFHQVATVVGGRKRQCFINMMLGRPHGDQTNGHRQRANPVSNRMQRAEEQQSSNRKSCGRTHQTFHYTAALDFSWGFFAMSDTFDAEPPSHAWPHCPATLSILPRLGTFWCGSALAARQEWCRSKRIFEKAATTNGS